MSEVESAQAGRPAQAAARFGSVVLLGVLLGLLGGVLWEFLWTAPTGAVWEGVWVPDRDGVPDMVGGTAWFVVVGVGYGLVYGLCVALLTRGRELLTLAAVLVGSLLAARVTVVVGGLLGPEDPDRLAPGMGNWEPLPGNLEVAGSSSDWWPPVFGSTALLAPTFAAVSVLCVAWFLTISRTRD